MNQPIQEYLRNKEARKNMPFHFNGSTGQKGYLVENGILASDEHLNELYPLGEKITLWDFIEKGKNPDTKRII